MTGWNLPPGCNVRDLPGNDDPPCEVCYRSSDVCVCPECPTCGVQGDIGCYHKHGLKFSRAQVIGRQEMRVIVYRDQLQEEEAYLAYLRDETQPFPNDLLEVPDPFE